MRYKIFGIANKFKNWPRSAYLGLELTSDYACSQKPNPSCEKVPVKSFASAAIREVSQPTNIENEKRKWNIIDPVQVVARRGGDRKYIIIMFWKYLVYIGNEAWLN